MCPKAKVTLAHISAAAEVSQATASMILSGRLDVSFSAETVERVRHAAKSLGYKGARRHLPPSLSSGALLIICPNIGNPYYASMVQAIQQAGHQHQLTSLVFTTYRKASEEERILRSVASSAPAGIIFTMLPQCRSLVERTAKTCPIVVIGDRDSALDVDTVELDNYGAGSLIAKHMVDLGHKHVAYISTTLNKDNSARVRRVEGLTDTWKALCPEGSVQVLARSISPDEELHDLEVEYRTGKELTEQCLSDSTNLALSAFVAVNDMVGYGVLNAIAEAGFSVPKDYSVCGFDNIFPSHFASLGLTSVDHHLEDKGHHAVEMICRAMGKTSLNITRVEYKPQLIARASTAPPPALCHPQG